MLKTSMRTIFRKRVLYLEGELHNLGKPWTLLLPQTTLFLCPLTPTNHAAVKLSLTGRIGAELMPVPQLALLKVADEPVTRRFLLRVVGQRTRVLDPKELLLPEIKGVTFSAAKAPDGKNLSLTATFGPGFTKQLLADDIIPFSVSVSVSVPGLASAKIICKIKK